MKKIFTIGELLIDVLSRTKNWDDNQQILKRAGGAPANVAACVAKLGGHSYFIGQVGSDDYGDFLINTMQKISVNTNYLYQTNQAPTAVVRVYVKSDGNRDFFFSQETTADMLFTAQQVGHWFQDDIIHFCSLSLREEANKSAHLKAISLIRDNQGIVSFDPNVRLPFWKDANRCRKIILEFIPQADIVKISDDELFFITGIQDVNQALESLFVGNVKLILYTKGKNGATLFTKNYHVSVPGYDVPAIDTTGAGDAFIGGFLFYLSRYNINIDHLDQKIGYKILNFSNAVAALATTKEGAIDSLPSYFDVIELMKSKFTNQ